MVALKHPEGHIVDVVAGGGKQERRGGIETRSRIAELELVCGSRNAVVALKLG